MFCIIIGSLSIKPVNKITFFKLIIKQNNLIVVLDATNLTFIVVFKVNTL